MVRASLLHSEGHWFESSTVYIFPSASFFSQLNTCVILYILNHFSVRFMKSKEKILARRLRTRGFSINEIKDKLRVAKSSVSLWVRDVIISEENQKKLSLRGRSIVDIEKRRQTRLHRENARRQIIIDRATHEIKTISRQELKLIGVMLYWGEGGKTGRGVVRFSNSDSEMIVVIMRFFREICVVPDLKFRGYLHIHPHLDYKKAEKYWSDISGIPLTQFYKTYRKMNVASKHKRDNIPLGTFDIYICNTELFLKIKGWIKGVVGRLAIH